MQDLGRVVGHDPGVALTEKRTRFVALIRQGVSNSEACRLVGVNRKSGKRWRYGRTICNTVGESVHYPAVTIKPASPRSSRYLLLDERTVIADLRRERCGVREIARRIGWAASTVSRELRGNADEGRYRPHAAQAKAQARMPPHDSGGGLRPGARWCGVRAAGQKVEPRAGRPRADRPVRRPAGLAAVSGEHLPGHLRP